MTNANRVKRRVRFNETVAVCEFPTNQRHEDDQYNDATWLKKNDCYQFSINNREIVRIMESNQVTMMTSPDEDEDEQAESTRGLEFFTSSAARQRNCRRKASHAIVFGLQQSHQPDYIAEVYRKACQSSQEIAYCMGLRDENYVRSQMMMMTMMSSSAPTQPQQLLATTMMNTSTHSNHSQVGKERSARPKQRRRRRRR